MGFRCQRKARSLGSVLAAPKHASSLAASPRRRASKQTTSQRKTRVGFFLRRPSGRTPVARTQVARLAPGCTALGYETVSGRPQWLSRDPIGENGGINLYAYVGNNPVNATDPLGLQELLLFEEPPILPPDLIKEALKQNADKNSVELPDGRRVDLRGRGHLDPDTGKKIECPHTHDPQAPFDAPYQNIPRAPNPIPRPSTWQDIQDVFSHLAKNVSNFFMGPPPTPDHNPPGMI